MEWSHEEEKIVERMCFSQHLLHSVISTALGPRALLSLELQDLRLCLAGMSLEPVRPLMGPRLSAPP
jgi:hypothetical protein